MASFLRGLKHLLAHHGHHQKAQDKAPNPALALAKNSPKRAGGDCSGRAGDRR